MSRFNADDLASLDRYWNPPPVLDSPPPQAARAQAGQFTGMDDPALLEFIRSQGGHGGGGYQLRNMAVLRCLSLICGTIGMLPLNLVESGGKKRIATEHPAHRLLKIKPNPWQTPLEFKRQMELARQRHGDAYARIVWSAGRPIHLIPLDSPAVRAELGDDWRMLYRFNSKKRGEVILKQEEVLHIRDLSVDGVTSLSRMKLADRAIRLALDAEQAASRIFETGNMAGGAIEVPNALSDVAYERMRTSLDTEYAGAAAAQRWMLLEENAKANKFGSTAQEAQHVENRSAQVEEVARLYGVPRPLLFLSDTSWGTGIEQLGIFFLQYTMLEHFTNWEQAVARSLIDERDLERYQPKFNVRALMRGTLKDQADFFKAALGSGGTAPFHTQNEVRDLLDYPESDQPGANDLINPMTQKGKSNEPPAAA
ncbi:phage portal protein [Stenotrophomonas sp. NY11291]|uniref:phage portal protein n=1 Tax=Stenotrophomonas sp. NY11291 TaxID=2939415 RepID=UPI00200CFBA0|nr:phage portal protein [Stenotrophomonas sp. NY11291]MBN5087541.1 phage portal protein [Stenotrophomonas maltophilia]UQA21511.1 phage portal protein [Stenotrophomonas sp. NY11291]